VIGDINDQAFRKAESNWRTVPRITGESIRFVRRAAPRYLERVWVMQAVAGVASALSVGATALLATRLLHLADGRAALRTLLPIVVLLTVLGLVGQVAAAYQTVNQEVVSEQVGAAALDRILDIVSTVELEAFDDPEFCDRLQIAEMQASIRPWQVVDSVSNLTRSLFAAVGITVALVVLSPFTVLLMLLIVAPVALVIGSRTKIEQEFVRNRSVPERLRGSFVGRLNSRDGAADARANALTGEIRSRIGVLQRDILSMKRVARRKQARLVVASNAGGIVIVGLTIAVLAWLFDRGHLSVPNAAALLYGSSACRAWLGSPATRLACSTRERFSCMTLTRSWPRPVRAVPATRSW
jgi:ATP-binding cassette, subfamily B, bacterial